MAKHKFQKHKVHTHKVRGPRFSPPAKGSVSFLFFSFPFFFLCFALGGGGEEEEEEKGLYLGGGVFTIHIAEEDRPRRWRARLFCFALIVKIVHGENGCNGWTHPGGCARGGYVQPQPFLLFSSARHLRQAPPTHNRGVGGRPRIGRGGGGGEKFNRRS